MFRPHFDICICHNEKRLIVVKKGYCAEGNYEQKKRNKNTNVPTFNAEIRDDVSRVFGEEGYQPTGCNRRLVQQIRNTSKASFRKTRKPIQYRKAGTGEAEIFAEIAAEREWICFVSGKGLMELTATQFMHVLPKALNKYPLFKLYKRNIQLATNEIHHLWDHTPRSELKKDRRFDKLFQLEEELKQEYKLLKQKT